MGLLGNLKLLMRLLEAGVIFLLNNADPKVTEARTKKKPHQKKPYLQPYHRKIKTSFYNPKICLIQTEGWPFDENSAIKANYQEK